VSDALQPAPVADPLADEFASTLLADAAAKWLRVPLLAAGATDEDFG
jgi:hypothetical protein